ncbi:hypothetical protein [Natroniella sulfidigena]|nr:hypothetical protein [Natroniella sulfidigena]
MEHDRLDFATEGFSLMYKKDKLIRIFVKLEGNIYTIIEVIVKEE